MFRSLSLLHVYFHTAVIISYVDSSSVPNPLEQAVFCAVKLFLRGHVLERDTPLLRAL